MFGLVFASVFSVLLYAQTESKMQISEPLSGVEAKKALQNFPKESKSALEVKKGAKGGNLYPWSSLVFNENTESYLTLSDSAGNPILIVLYTNDSPGIIKEDNLVINNDELKMSCDEPECETECRNDPECKAKCKTECCPKYKTYVVSKYDPTTKTFKTEKVCPYVYYNGGRNANAEYSEWGIPYTNSFGLWIKLGGYFTTPITLFNRNEVHSEAGGYRTDFFNFQVLESGKLSVKTKLTNTSFDNIITTKPIPLNKWVYVQAIQNVKKYQVGWKTEDGSDEDLVEKTFSPSVALDDAQLKSRQYNIKSLQNYIEAGDNKYYLNVKEVFYEPTIQTMFALMNNYNTKEKLIFSTGEVNSIPISILGLEAYKILAGIGSSIITINDFDIYYDDTTGNILAVDFRVKK